MKKNNKGFTLVELIVVLVILAILAAILVPALLGYIDKARQSQYEEEAHSILTAMQAYNTEQYAKGEDPITAGSNSDVVSYVNKIVSPTKIDSWGAVAYTAATNPSVSNSTSHKAYTITGITDLKFKSQNKEAEVTCTLSNGSWTITDVKN